ncbi:hypothetical protein FACS189465_1060 [Clostridia bacterium]|nr:hypothetical protein FACS189465_1060 [Clostridia bacterium]
MTKDQFEREKNYQTARYLIRKLLKNDFLTEKEYAKIDTKLLEKYRPIFGRLNSRK